MEGFKNSTRMKTFGDVAPQAYAKGGAVKPMVKAVAKAPAKAKDCAPMKKASGGDVSKMTRDQRMASMEKSSRAMTPAETRSMQAIKAAKAAAPKREPLIKPARQMTPAERRMNEMDRPTNSRGAEAYKSGGKVGASKVPFLEKKTGEKYASKGAMAKHERGESFAVKKSEGEKVMRKAMGGAVNMPEMPSEEVALAPMVAADYRPTPMPEMTEEPMMPAPRVMNIGPDLMRQIGSQINPEALAKVKSMLNGADRIDTTRAADMVGNVARTVGKSKMGRGLASMIGRRDAAPRFMR